MSKRQPEQQIQRAVFEHLRRRSTPDVFAFHPANGGYRTAIEAAIFKSLGVVAGVPDLIIIKGGAVFALELKSKGNKLTPIQTETIDHMRQAGCVVGVAVGIDEALRFLEHHNLLKGETQ
jgi:hypothetical protein